MRKVLLFFGILNDADLDWVAATGTKMDIPPGKTLIEEGMPIGFVFLVLDGILSVSNRATGSREIARLHDGEIVGEMSFVDAGSPSSTVSAVEKTSVLAIPRAILQRKLEEDPGFASRFYRALAVFLSERMRATVGLLGYGNGARLGDASTYSDELSSDILDHTSLAGARFDLLRRRLRAM